MSDLKIFKNSEFGELGVLIKDGKEHFPATECAKILGYKNPQRAIREHCKGVNEMVTPSKGGQQLKKYIPEGDLYRLIVKSRLPSAEKFEKWVFEEVLPSIRKHGGYLTPDKIEEVLLNPDTIITLATNLKNEMAKNKMLESQVEYLEETKAQISRKREASAMNTASQLSKKLKKLTDNEKRFDEFSATEVAKIAGVYSRNGNPHSQAVSAFLSTLPNKNNYARTVKVQLPTEHVIDSTYFNELFVDKFMAYSKNNNSLYVNGRNFKFIKL